MFLVWFEVCVFYFQFSLTKHMYLYYFSLWSDMCISLVFMWSWYGKMESSTASSDKSLSCFTPNSVAAAVRATATDSSPPFIEPLPQGLCNQWPLFSVSQGRTGEMRRDSGSSHLCNALEVRQYCIPLHRPLGNQHYRNKVFASWSCIGWENTGIWCRFPHHLFGYLWQDWWHGHSSEAFGPSCCAIHALQDNHGCTRRHSQIQEREVDTTVRRAS